MARAFELATILAEKGDWTFDGLDGWVNQFPDVQEIISEFIKNNTEVQNVISGMGRNHDAAKAVVMQRI
jgi:hypothetical protein